MRKTKGKSEGITLIALVITIIVLLILAGVTISFVMGDSGVISKSMEAKQKTQIASEKEKIELMILDLYTQKTEQGNGKLTVNEVIDKLIEKGITTEGNSTKADETKGEITGNVTLDSGNNYTLTEAENTVTVEYNGPSVDKTGPEITGVGTEVGPDTITIIVTGIRDVGIGTEGIEYRYFINKEGSSWTEYGASATHEFTELEEGTEYTIQIQAKDRLGNEGKVFSTTDTTEVISNIKEYHAGVPIPKGFYYVGGEPATGLVISDKAEDENLGASQTDLTVNLQGNQFVWVPITVTAKDTETNIASFQRTNTYDETITDPGSNYTEPYSNGNLSSENDLTGEYAEYTKMVKSVFYHKGFYVARYEAGSVDNRTSINYQDGPVLSKKNRYVYCNVSWGRSMESTEKPYSFKGAVELSREMYPVSNKNYGAVSHLIYGVQWDAIMKFVQDSTHNVTNSSSWGNYEEYTGAGTYSKGKVQKTGVNEKWKVKNIYDLAGNVKEWTMESFSNATRVMRGGSSASEGREACAGNRSMDLPRSYNEWTSFRPVLYVKD